MHWVRDVAWSPDDTQIASVSDDKCVKVWDIEKGLLVKNINGHDGVIYGVIWANDLNRIVTVSADENVMFWIDV